MDDYGLLSNLKLNPQHAKHTPQAVAMDQPRYALSDSARRLNHNTDLKRIINIGSPVVVLKV